MPLKTLILGPWVTVYYNISKQYWRLEKLRSCGEDKRHDYGFL
jgi:hypothetical protein